MMKTKRTLMRALVASTALAAAGSTFADTIYNNFNGYSDFWHPFGNPNTATYGETFTAPTNGDVNLQDFGFYMGNPERPRQYPAPRVHRDLDGNQRRHALVHQRGLRFREHGE